MILDDYFVSPGTRASNDSAWLWQEDVLQDADLIDIRQRLFPKTVGLLLDLRQALQIRHGNTAALIVREVSKVHWDDQTHRNDRVAWKISGSQVTLINDYLSLVLHFIWPASLTLEGRRAELYVGNIGGLSEAPSDYVADADAAIEANQPSWTGAFELVTYAEHGQRPI